MPKRSVHVDDNSDVEIMDADGLEAINCQLCNISLVHLTVVERQAHYDDHFNDTPAAAVHARVNGGGGMYV